MRHLILLATCAILLFLAGHLLPKLAGISPSDLVPSLAAPPPPSDSLKKADTLGFAGGLRQALPVLQTIKGRGKGASKRPDVWMLGNGISIPNYMLKAQRYILSNKGTVTSMEELHGKLPSALLSCKDSTGNSLTVELRVGETFLDSASRISVAFQVDTLTSSSLDALSKLDFTVTLLVTPFDSSQALFAMLDQLKHKELVAWIPMESHNLLSAKLGPHSIQIHHSESEIAETIDDAFRRMPESVGMATRLGQRAVEHKPLLDAVVKSLAARKGWFWDLSANRFSESMAACGELGLPCMRTSPFDPDRGTMPEYIQKALNLARKSGKAAIVMPLNAEALDAIAHFKESAAAQGTEIVNISSIIAEDN